VTRPFSAKSGHFVSANLDGSSVATVAADGWGASPFLNYLLRVISGHEVQLFAAFPRVEVALICVGMNPVQSDIGGFPFSCQSLSVIQSSELENRAADQDGRKSVRSFADVKRVCFDSGLLRVAIFVQRPSLTHSLRTDAKSGA
jgi:hypothetical protein